MHGRVLKEEHGNQINGVHLFVCQCVTHVMYMWCGGGGHSRPRSALEWGEGVTAGCEVSVLGASTSWVEIKNLVALLKISGGC